MCVARKFCLVNTFTVCGCLLDVRQAHTSKKYDFPGPDGHRTCNFLIDHYQYIEAAAQVTHNYVELAS